MMQVSSSIKASSLVLLGMLHMHRGGATCRCSKCTSSARALHSVLICTLNCRDSRASAVIV